MFGRDALTNLSQVSKPNFRYMGTDDLILDLKLMSNIFQTQIHNLRTGPESMCNQRSTACHKAETLTDGDIV